MMSYRGKTKAFTLIELLVVIAIISLLIGILLPAIGRARQTAQSLVCGTTQRGIGQAVFQYTLDNRDFYPGVNTSGAGYRFFNPDNPPLGMEFNTTSSTPTSIWDWFSPALGDSLALSSNRAQRTAQIFNQYGCASANVFNDELYNNWIDIADFERVQSEQGFKQVSYLSPATFHYYSGSLSGNAAPLIDPTRGNIRYLTGFRDPATTPTNFRPRLTNVGTSPSSKIFSADGTRYVAPQGSGFILDFDIASNAQFYGSFGSQTPIRHQSPAYGRAAFGNTNLNVELSVRHNGSINAVYFDGHVASMTRERMYEDPNPWHPTGSVFTGTGATPESIEFMEEQQGNRSTATIY